MRKLDVIQSYYESNRKPGAADYEILGWESEEAQKMRFDILASNIDLHGKRILDVGCGLGNLLEYLNHRNIPVVYTGVDILPDMIAQAKQKGMQGDFYCLDVFKDNPFLEGQFDVVYASGIFNLNLGNNQPFLQKALEKFFFLASQSVAFNLLHHLSPDRENTYYYFSPDEVAELLESMPIDLQEVRMIEQYLKNDFTVICKK